MIRDIYLFGAAGREFGRHFRLDVSSPAEAVRALMTLRPGLRDKLRQGWWRVIVGRPHITNSIPANILNMNAGGQPLYIVPATSPAGGGRGKSIGSIILGTLLIIGGAVLTYFGQPYGPGLIITGAGMVFGGISSLLTPLPTDISPTDKARPDDQPSFLFNGVTNTSQPGAPVPLVFGRHLVGSVVVSAGIYLEEIYMQGLPGGSQGKPGLPFIPTSA